MLGQNTGIQAAHSILGAGDLAFNYCENMII